MQLVGWVEHSETHHGPCLMDHSYHTYKLHTRAALSDELRAGLCAAERVLRSVQKTSRFCRRTVRVVRELGRFRNSTRSVHQREIVVSLARSEVIIVARGFLCSPGRVAGFGVGASRQLSEVNRPRTDIRPAGPDEEVDHVVGDPLPLPVRDESGLPPIPGVS
jgi:hypothetical protein